MYGKYVRLKFSTSKIKITKNKKIHPGVTAYTKNSIQKNKKNKAGKLQQHFQASPELRVKRLISGDTGGIPNNKANPT